MTWRLVRIVPSLSMTKPGAEAALGLGVVAAAAAVALRPEEALHEVVAEEVLEPLLGAARAAHDLLGADVHDARRLPPRDLLEGVERDRAARADRRRASAAGSRFRASAAVGRWIWFVTTAPNSMAAIATEKNDAIVRLRVFIDLEPPSLRRETVVDG